MENERLKNKKPGDEPGSGSSLTPTRKGYKKTEVGVVPEDWWVSNLGAVCAMKSGEGITSEDIDQSSQYPCYGGNGLRGFTSRFTHDGCYALIGRQGALCGNIVYAKGKLFASEHAVVVTAKPQINILWLTYVLYDMRLNQYSESSAQPGLSVNKLLSLELAVPPTLAEQSAIAVALSDADALIDSLEQLIAKKLLVKQGAMQALLTGKRRLPGFEVKKGYKHTEEGEIPEDWELDYIDNFADITTGSKNTQDRVDDGQYPFFVRSQTIEHINSYSFDGEAVLTAGDGVGTGKVFHYINGKFDVHQRVYRISQFSGRVNGFFFYLFFSSHFYNRIMQMTAKSSVDSVRREMIARMLVPIPPIKPEQTAIASILSDMDAEISALESKLSKTRAIKQGMMQELLTGRIRLV
jgi:type I restriction enzyme S subunit